MGGEDWWDLVYVAKLLEYGVCCEITVLLSTCEQQVNNLMYESKAISELSFPFCFGLKSRLVRANYANFS